jgi:hypothetical protein
MRGEFSIQVNKEKLLAALEENRDKHADAYQKARLGYIKLTRNELEAALDKLDRGEMLHRILSNVPPDNHTGDYDDAIDMMKWSTDTTIELTQAQFKQYVKDDWGWKDQWTTSNTAYLEA